jgi:hypothetical protein
MTRLMLPRLTISITQRLTIMAIFTTMRRLARRLPTRPRFLLFCRRNNHPPFRLTVRVLHLMILLYYRRKSLLLGLPLDQAGDQPSRRL